MTKNGFVSLLLAAVLEAGLIGGYLWDSSRFEGLFPQIISQLSLFARFYTIVNGVAVVQNGELVTADEGELAARANAAVCHYLGRC